MWRCKCECGNEKIVYGGHLENGHTQSCGCYRPPRADLVEQKFGRLTVQKWLGNGKWQCLCDCGNIVSVQTYNLKNGNTKSCGCLQKEKSSEASFKSLVGMKFGKLTVVKRVENNRFGHVCYLCTCECGGSAIVDATNLRGGITNSCGCIKSKGEMKINQWLTSHNIDFIPQYSHNDIFLSSGRRPFFDFAIFNDNKELLFLLEYQGPQHYGYSEYGWDNEENFKQTVRRDEERKARCKELNIPLYEIPYWEFDNIDTILTNIIIDMEEAQEVEN